MPELRHALSQNYHSNLLEWLKCWNLSSHPPITSSNSNFLVTLTRVHEKNRSNEIHGTKCYYNYLESMESMTTTILWHNDTITHCIFWICLNMINVKLRWERESKRWVQGSWSLNSNDLPIKLTFTVRGLKGCNTPRFDQILTLLETNSCNCRLITWQVGNVWCLCDNVVFNHEFANFCARKLSITEW